MDIEVGRLPRARVRAASRLLAAAFADDGILSHYLPGRRGRRLAIPAFFAAVIHEHLETTYAATAGRELVGVAAFGHRPTRRLHLSRHGSVRAPAYSR
jgi:hypothetical protein